MMKHVLLLLQLVYANDIYDPNVEMTFGTARPMFLLVGDSITEMSGDPHTLGFQSLMSQAYSRRVDVINRGFSGYTTRNTGKLLKYVEKEWAAHPPVFACIFLGANDAAIRGQTNAVPLTEYEDNLKGMVVSLKKAFPGIHLMLITPPPIDNKRQADRKNEITKRYADTCKEIAKTFGLPVIDTWTEIQKQPNWQKLMKDGLHFNTAGNVVMYELLQKTLDAAYPQLQVKNMPRQFP